MTAHQMIEETLATIRAAQAYWDGRRLPTRQTSLPETAFDENAEDEALLTDRESEAIESLLSTTRGAERVRVHKHLILAAALDHHGEHPLALSVLRRLAARGASPQADGGPGRALDGAARDIDAVATLDAQVEQALDRANITDTTRRLGAKIESRHTGQVPRWLPKKPEEVTATSPLLDRVHAKLDEYNTDPIMRMAINLTAMQEGEEPEILHDENRMNGIRKSIFDLD